ncbi:MAG TPA: FecR domain-containing protein [Terriglobales bacterium]|nr:FecR domain-containing protein [Terriglobales bacterium]
MKAATGDKMSSKIEVPLFRRSVALLLCFVLSPFSGTAFADVGNTTPEIVGKVTGVVFAVTRNGANISLNDVVRRSDTFATDDSGRFSIELQDGSTLSAGTSTKLTVVQHEPLTGETSINLNSGRLRSRIVKLRNFARFEITTPHTTIIAMGTDFFIDVRPFITQVVVYSGVVVVTSSGTSSPGASAKVMLDVVAGETVAINQDGVSRLQLTPEGLEQQTMAATIVPEVPVPMTPAKQAIAKKTSHATRNILIGGLAAGAVMGAVVGLRGSRSQATASTPSVPPTIPAH